ARRLLPDVSRPRERLHRLPGSMQLLEAVPAAEQAEMIGRERCERAIVPAERLGPLLLALKVPADRAVKDGGPTRRELGAAQQVALDLLLVAEHAEGPADLEEQLRSEEHTSELQSRGHLVCRLLLEKKKTQQQPVFTRTYR